MYFANATLFRFPLSFVPALARLEECLAENPLLPIGPQALQSAGFVSPLGKDGDRFSLDAMHYKQICLGVVERILPAASVSEKVEETIREIEKKHERQVRARERRQIKEDTIFSMIPHAFTKRSIINAYLDLKTGTLVVDTSSRKAAERVVNELRHALGSFPATPISSLRDPSTLMTSWLQGRELMRGIELGDEASLKAQGAHGAKVKLSHQDLECDEVKRHLDAGKQCTAVAVCFDDTISAVLNGGISLKKIKFLNLDLLLAEQESAESAEAELTARFLVTASQLAVLFEALFNAFQVVSAEPLFDTATPIAA